MEKKYYEETKTDSEMGLAYWNGSEWSFNKSLVEVPGIPLSVERYEALMKCVEALEQIKTIEASNNERWSYEAMNICEQSLQTLKQTSNE